MERFLQRHAERVVGTLTGFDRLLFRGTLRSISYVKGMEILMSRKRILHRDFGRFAERISTRLKEHARGIADEAGRPFVYLGSSRISKEDYARDIRERDGIEQGLVCVLTCIEPCHSYQMVRNPQTRHLELRPAERKCLHIYFYYQDREFGPMHIRRQTWLPMSIQVCINRREYLARQLDREGIGYEQRDNCFVSIDDLPRAQELLDQLVDRQWHRVLDRLAARVNPWLDEAEGFSLRGYYWSVRQGEVATDVMFTDEAALAELYPSLVDHAVRNFSCRDTLKFLGRRTNTRFSGEVTIKPLHRREGICVKHRVEENSIKMYDKQGRVLRIETTINNPRRFKVRRATTRHGEPRPGWLPLRKGIADIRRRVEISRAANARYLEALATAHQPTPAAQVIDPVQRRITRHGRPYRALRPVTPDENAVFESVLRGEHHLQGFRNADLRRTLYPHEEATRDRRRRASGKVTRWLRLLRAHGLIRKVPTTRYYRVTTKGQQVMSTAMKLRQLDLTP